MTDEELERLARAATAHGEEWNSRTALSCFEPRHQQFIAAFNPSTALALLERVRKAEDRAALLQSKGGILANEASAILSPAKAREFALAILRQADAMEPLPSLLDEYRASDSERAVVRTVARAAAEDMRERAAKRLEAIAEGWREGPRAMASEMIANFKEAAALVRTIDLPGDKP